MIGIEVVDRREGGEGRPAVIHAEHVVLCGGMWSRELGLRCGVESPLHPVEHHWVLTTPIEGAHDELPVGRDPDRPLAVHPLDGIRPDPLLGHRHLRKGQLVTVRCPDSHLLEALHRFPFRLGIPDHHFHLVPPALETLDLVAIE